MKYPVAAVTAIFVGFVSLTSYAQETPPPAPSEPSEVVTTPMPMVQENTVVACGDSVDNDYDGYVDCDDQDCEVFVICHKETNVEVEVKVEEEEVDPEPMPERGRLCRDGKDNNEDGYIDCHEKSCQRYAYCRRHMYYVPEPPDKAPGYFLNFGWGVALPNFRGPEVETHVPEYGNIPFDPDVGLMFSMKTGWLFLKWLGLGVNFNFGATGASNYERYLLDSDSPDLYKYDGGQVFAHVGGVVRFQWPYCRFVPYIDVAAGFSFMEYQWYIYRADNAWDDIREDIIDPDGDAYIQGTSYVNKEKFTHFTLAIEPGFDFYVSSRRFAIGLKGWLPVFASHNPESDNIGIMASFTYTPKWREPPQLRPEYERTGKQE